MEFIGDLVITFDVPAVHCGAVTRTTRTAVVTLNTPSDYRPISVTINPTWQHRTVPGQKWLNISLRRPIKRRKTS